MDYKIPEIFYMNTNVCISATSLRNQDELNYIFERLYYPLYW